MRVDRRLIPGDDPEQAAAGVRDALGDMSPYQVTAEMGEYMLPALVDPDHPGVLSLTRSHHQVFGEDAQQRRLAGHALQRVGEVWLDVVQHIGECRVRFLL